MEISKKRFLLEAHIVNHRESVEKKFPYSKYTEYEVMFNSKYKIWRIYRRYSQFDELHKKLSKTIKNLPTLPQKAFFNFSTKLIEERKVGLQNYMNQLFHVLNVYSNSDLLEFIEVEKEVLILMSKYNTFIDSPRNNLSFVKTRVKSNTFYEAERKSNVLRLYDLSENLDFEEKEVKLDEAQVINEFLDQLEKQGENKINTVSFFISYLKSEKAWPKFKKEDIARLLFGDLNSHKGLLYHCGTLEENKLGAEACIQLFGKLVSFEFNPDCEYYIQILKKMPLTYLKKMNMMEHIHNNNKEVCFKILKLIQDDKEIMFRSLINDKNVLEKYETWLMNRL